MIYLDSLEGSYLNSKTLMQLRDHLYYVSPIENLDACNSSILINPIIRTLLRNFNRGGKNLPWISSTFVDPSIFGNTHTLWTFPNNRTVMTAGSSCLST